LGQEYDRLLPPHLVLEPVPGTVNQKLNPDFDPMTSKLRVGDLVSVSGFHHFETRADMKSLTLFGAPEEGRPVYRLRWLSANPPKNSTARIISTRDDLLAQTTASFDLLGYPNPLPKLEGWLQEILNGTRSIIHGDLNLENILVGPGNLVWLIDFAQTREGHPLYDFSHLASEIIGHVLSRRGYSATQFLAILQKGSDPLLDTIERIALRCSFNPSNSKEYRLALILSCLGALKYLNVSDQGKYFLFLTAAFLGSQES
jgi:hypothetical protein